LNLKRNFLSIGRIIDEGIITLFNFNVYFIVTKKKSPYLLLKVLEISPQAYTFSLQNPKKVNLLETISMSQKND
jgi:hypothetical protein